MGKIVIKMVIGVHIFEHEDPFFCSFFFFFFFLMNEHKHLHANTHLDSQKKKEGKFMSSIYGVFLIGK